jgi:hypothetical protein
MPQQPLCANRLGGTLITAIFLAGLIAPSAFAGVVINEVVCDPTSFGRENPIPEAVRIELYNAGPDDVFLADWTISNRDAVPGIILPPWALPAGAFLTIHLTDGIDDPDFADGAGDLYVGDPGPLFNTPQDECALFQGPPGLDTIIDFLAWSEDAGYLPGPAHTLASGAGIWPHGSYIDTSDRQPGASLARYFDGFDRNLTSDWRLVPIATYVHRLAFRIENPVQLEPRNRDVTDNTQPTFEWVAVPGATHYSLQVARDFLFTDLVLDAPALTDTQFTSAAPLPDDAYFWRVRADIGGDLTPWAAEWLFVVNTGSRVVEQFICRSCPHKYQR